MSVKWERYVHTKSDNIFYNNKIITHTHITWMKGVHGNIYELWFLICGVSIMKWCDSEFFTIPFQELLCYHVYRYNVL